MNSELKRRWYRWDPSVKIWWKGCEDSEQADEEIVWLKDNIDDVEYMNLSEELLPEEPWDESTWDNWIALLKDKTSKSGKELFLPIRIALTGKSNGPELNKLILLVLFFLLYFFTCFIIVFY